MGVGVSVSVSVHVCGEYGWVWLAGWLGVGVVVCACVRGCVPTTSLSVFARVIKYSSLIIQSIKKKLPDGDPTQWWPPSEILDKALQNTGEFRFHHFQLLKRRIAPTHCSNGQLMKCFGSALVHLTDNLSWACLIAQMSFLEKNHITWVSKPERCTMKLQHWRETHNAFGPMLQLCRWCVLWFIQSFTEPLGGRGTSTLVTDPPPPPPGGSATAESTKMTTNGRKLANGSL